ncbi:protein-lysine N-methyltransferase EEF2KMT isoform X5 [Pseudoliparis swirei]|uniref:protein-lysine N-methyltransferase EEF2KMT isoform X5 n=1 Tax=Pseudoliparis swirei TaxID=2059687 RepID=UPI0024BEBAB8|nr:protein-lysine N-methyltransferase EEF2KMT isoform X5 [Pseudoliparis swirei]
MEGSEPNRAADGRTVNKEDVLRDFQASFFAMSGLASFPWTFLEKDLERNKSSDLISDILSQTCLHSLCRRFPPSARYRKLFLSQLITRVQHLSGGGGLRPAGRALRRAGRGGRRRIPDGVLQELPAARRRGYLSAGERGAGLRRDHRPVDLGGRAAPGGVGSGPPAPLHRQDGSGARQRRWSDRHRHLPLLQPEQIRVQRLSPEGAAQAERQRAAERADRAGGRRGGDGLDDGDGRADRSDRRRHRHRCRCGLRPGRGGVSGGAAVQDPEGLVSGGLHLLHRQEPGDVRRLQAAARRSRNRPPGGARSRRPDVPLQPRV